MRGHGTGPPQCPLPVPSAGARGVECRGQHTVQQAPMGGYRTSWLRSDGLSVCPGALTGPAAMRARLSVRSLSFALPNAPCSITPAGGGGRVCASADRHCCQSVKRTRPCCLTCCAVAMGSAAGNLLPAAPSFDPTPVPSQLGKVAGTPSFASVAAGDFTRHMSWPGNAILRCPRHPHAWTAVHPCLDSMSSPSPCLHQRAKYFVRPVQRCAVSRPAAFFLSTSQLLTLQQ